MCIPCQGNVLPYRIFRNLCCKSLKFSKKESKEKSYRLMNKERKEQIRTLFHLFLCYLRIFLNLHLHFYCWYIFVSGARPISGQRFNSVSPENTREPEAVYVANGNPSFCLSLYLTGVHFRGELQHVGNVSEQKIKCWSIGTQEIGGVTL